jgi:hypothetical protein
VEQHCGQDHILRTSVRVGRIKIIPSLGESAEGQVAEGEVNAIPQIVSEKKPEIKHGIGATRSSRPKDGDVELDLLALNRNVRSSDVHNRIDVRSSRRRLRRRSMRRSSQNINS